MTLDQAIRELKIRNEPTSMQLPSFEEVKAMESLLGITFHADYVRFLLEASDVYAGFIEPATITDPNHRTYLPKVVARGRHYRVPEHLLPICDDNADFYCLTSDGQVVFWSHNGWDSWTLPNLAAWISDVWLAKDE
jgi:hypothetical protein